MIVDINRVRELALSELIESGIASDESEIVINHLLDEELLGKHSHGFIRLASIVRNAKQFDGKSKIVIENPTEYASRIQAKDTLGIVAAYKTTEQVISIADENGFAIASAIGYTGTTGALGYYARMIAKNNLIGIISCSSEYAVAPWGGKDAILGTNPIAIAIPNGDDPIISDFATSAMTYGDLMLAVKEKREVPYGVVLDSQGKPSHDPDDANNGCQLPMAEHKGYALGLAVEVLAGLFIGAKAGKDAVLGSDGIVMMAIKPDLFVPQNQFDNNVKALINEIRGSSLAFESTGIRIPGENSIKKIEEGYKTGKVEIPGVVYQEMISNRA